MTIKQLLGLRIKELRTKIKLTQAQLAEKVGIDPKHQSCIENGKNFPSADLLNKYAKIFNLDICVLLELKHNQPREVLENYIHEKIRSCCDEDLKIIYRIISAVLN